MSNHKNDFMDLHFAAVAGTLLNTRPQQAAADRDAEPEPYEARHGAIRRFVASVSVRRGRAVPSAKRV